MDLLPLAIAGGGLWWLSRRLAPRVEPGPVVPGRDVIIQREIADTRDDPAQQSDDLRGWALRAGRNGGGDYLTGSLPPEPRWLAIVRDGRRPGVIASVPYLAAPGALMRAAMTQIPGNYSATRGGREMVRASQRKSWGLPGSMLAVRLGIEQPKGLPPASDRLLMPQLPGQVAGGIPALGVGQGRYRGLVALGALWSNVASTRAWWPFGDALDHRAGGGWRVIYLVSALGRAAVVVGAQPRLGPAERSPIGQLAADAWTPIVRDASGRPSRRLVLPRSDRATFAGAGPGRSPWIGQALLQFLALPVVELPGLPTVTPGQVAGAGMPRMYDGARWSDPAWSRARSRLQPGMNWAQRDSGARAYPETLRGQA